MYTTCPICGQYHDTTACPPPLMPCPREVYEQSGQATINGLTFGEHEICRRLDRIIELLTEQDTNQGKPTACKHGYLVGENYRCTICDPLSNDDRRAIGIESEKGSE